MTAITVIVPTIAGRERMLSRAVKSVHAQTHRPIDLLTLVDEHGAGAAACRDRMLADVDTDWVAPLDDDDVLYPQHLADLLACAESTGADLAYPWFDVHGPTGKHEQWRDPHSRWEGAPWDPETPHQVPVTVLARTAVLRAVGGWTDHGRWTPDMAGIDEAGNRVGEDYLLIQRLVAVAARIVHHPARTWRWNHHGKNTSGRPQ